MGRTVLDAESVLDRRVREAFLLAFAEGLTAYARPLLLDAAEADLSDVEAAEAEIEERAGAAREALTVRGDLLGRARGAGWLSGYRHARGGYQAEMNGAGWRRLRRG